MRNEIVKETLVRQPSYILQVVKTWCEDDQPTHAFVLYPTMLGGKTLDGQGVTLLAGEGHDIARRDMHYALYLFQRFHLNHAQPEQQAKAAGKTTH